MPYDMEKTSMAVQKHAGGNELDPMWMLYRDVENCFKLIGEKNATIADIKVQDAEQTMQIKQLKEQMVLLQARLWQILSGVILAAVGGAVTWFVS